MDSNDVALDRMANDYNVYYFPIGFIDGGYEVALSQYNQQYYIDAIEGAGARGVTPMSLFVSVEFLVDKRLLIHVVINGVGGWLCGDADRSGSVDIDDAVYLIAYIFSGGPPPYPPQAGDPDCSGGVDIDDVVHLIAYIFSGGPSPCDADGDGVPDC
jgi:hypothetical protein